MSMSFGLTATLSTSQKLTPQMQQAIKLLQLSSLELAQEVQAKLDSNPLLERVEDDADSTETYGDSEAVDGLELWNNTNSSDASTVVMSEDNDAPISDSWDKLQQSTFEAFGRLPRPAHSKISPFRFMRYLGLTLVRLS